MTAATRASPSRPEQPRRVPPDGRRRVPAGHALLVMLIALVVAAFLNGESLVHTAETQPFGTQRDLALTASRPVRWISNTFGLDIPRDLFEDAIGSEELESGGFGAGLADDALPPVTAAPVDPGEGTTVDPGTGLGPTPQAPIAPVPVQFRKPTAADPLRVFFAGDSLIGNISTGFGQVFSGEERMTMAVDYQVSTGLARPDVLDWPTYLSRVLQERGNDEVVVLMFGGNDDQDMETPEGRVTLFSEEWVAEYTRRIGIMMDVARADDRTVVWLGLPAMEIPRLEQARQIMNHAAANEAAKRPNVEYVDLSETLTPDGVYLQTIGDVTARLDDGAHITIDGAELVAEDIFEAFATVRRLR